MPDPTLVHASDVFNREVIEAIRSERQYQEKIWPNQLKVGEEILVMEEYLKRARKEWSGEQAPEYRTLEIIRKIAAVAFRCLEHHGAPPRILSKAT
jgi:hypothetical protein